jgi:hypothetical protein
MSLLFITPPGWFWVLLFDRPPLFITPPFAVGSWANAEPAMAKRAHSAPDVRSFSFRFMFLS